MNARYLLGAILTLPLLPLLYIQGKRIRDTVPKLPEPSDREGIAAPYQPHRLQLLTLGESTIAGVGVDTHQEGFTGTLANLLATELEVAVQWKVYAGSGLTAKKLCQTLVPAIAERRADLIVVGLGGNDAFRLNSPQRWRRHVQQLINALRMQFKETPIVFINMPPIKEFPAFTPLIRFVVGNLVELLGQTLENLIAGQKYVYYYSTKITAEDWITRLRLDHDPEDFFSDGVHPSRLTYQIWAKEVANYMIKDPLLKAQLLNRLQIKR